MQQSNVSARVQPYDLARLWISADDNGYRLRTLDYVPSGHNVMRVNNKAATDVAVTVTAYGRDPDYGALQRGVCRFE